MPEVLSISIPTYNRSSYLRRLLRSIEINFNKFRELNDCVRIYVFDNDSPDDTGKTVAESSLNIIYLRNDRNIGGAENIYQAYVKPEGDYVWVIGDDEILYHDAIIGIIQSIKQHSPVLIIPKTTSVSCKYFDNLEFYENYKSYIEYSLKTSPYRLIAHSFISCNVIKSSLFDSDLAKKMIYKSLYAQFYGIVSKLASVEGAVIACRKRQLVIRTERAPGLLEPGEILRNYEQTITNKKELHDSIFQDKCRYLEWLQGHFSITVKLSPEKIIFSELDLMRRENLQKLLARKKYFRYSVIKILDFIIKPSTIETFRYKLSKGFYSLSHRLPFIYGNYRKS